MSYGFSLYHVGPGLDFEARRAVVMRAREAYVPADDTDRERKAALHRPPTKRSSPAYSRPDSRSSTSPTKVRGSSNSVTAG
jgi:hypothetical protein